MLQSALLTEKGRRVSPAAFFIQNQRRSTLSCWQPIDRLARRQPMAAIEQAAAVSLQPRY